LPIPSIGAVSLALLFGLFNLVYGIWALARGVDLRRAHRTVDSLLDEEAPKRNQLASVVS
jgi:hypothetical protein